MLTRADDGQSLADWAHHNGIDLGDEDERMVGYWCRVSGVRLSDEAIRRDWTRDQESTARVAWREADEEIVEEQQACASP